MRDKEPSARVMEGGVLLQLYPEAGRDVHAESRKAPDREVRGTVHWLPPTPPPAHPDDPKEAA